MQYLPTELLQYHICDLLSFQGQTKLICLTKNLYDTIHVRSLDIKHNQSFHDKISKHKYITSITSHTYKTFYIKYGRISINLTVLKLPTLWYSGLNQRNIINFHSLKVLSLNSNYIFNLNHLANSLSELVINSNSLRQYGISALNCIKKFTLMNNSIITSLNHFRDTLLELSLHNCNNVKQCGIEDIYKLRKMCIKGITKISSVNHLLNINYLDIPDTTNYINYNKLQKVTTYYGPNGNYIKSPDIESLDYDMTLLNSICNKKINQEIVSDMTNIRCLTIKNNYNTYNLRHLSKSLVCLSLHETPNITKEGLCHMTSLKCLHIKTNRYLSNISDICSTLTELNLTFCSKVNQKGIMGLTNIKKLTIFSNKNITSLNHMGDNLTYLNISYCPGICQNGIEKLTNIKKLTVLSNNNITSISHMKSLMYLKLLHSQNITQGGIEGLDHVRIFILNGNDKITSISHMHSTLSIIKFKNCEKVTISDKALAFMENIIYIYMYECPSINEYNLISLAKMNKGLLYMRVNNYYTRNFEYKSNVYKNCELTLKGIKYIVEHS